MLSFNVQHLRGRLALSLPRGAFIGEITAQVQQGQEAAVGGAESTNSGSTEVKRGLSSSGLLPEFLPSHHIQMVFITLQRES